MLNPLAAIVQQFRHAVIDPSAPSTVDVLGSYALLMVPVAIVIASVVVGFLVFRRAAPPWPRTSDPADSGTPW